MTFSPADVFPRPYVKGLPIKLIIQRQLPNGDFSEQVTRPTYVDSYTLELDLIYDAVVNKKEYKTTPLDAKNDTILAKMIMDALVDWWWIDGGLFWISKDKKSSLYLCIQKPKMGNIF